MKKLENKSLVIIGGTSGLGLSAARAFLTEGARLVIVGRDQEKLDAARATGHCEGVSPGGRGNEVLRYFRWNAKADCPASVVFVR